MLLASALAGCDDSTLVIRSLRKQNQAHESRIGQLERELVDVNQELTKRNAQIKILQRLGVRRLELLNPAKSIEIDRLSGGFDEDGLPGDDGVVIYLKLIDAEGDVIKAAGEIEIQLLDLANRPEEYLIGQYFLDVAHARKLWYGKFMTRHYTIQCPWRDRPPEHSEITVRAMFTDYISGSVLTHQRVIKIDQAPAITDAS